MPWQQNKRTGEWREVTSAGMPVQAPQQGAIPIGPRNTYKMPQEAASLDSTQTGTVGKQIDNRVAAATVPAQIQQAQAGAAKESAQASNAQQDLRLNGLPAATYQQALNQFNGAGMIHSAAADMRDKFNSGPGSTKNWFNGISDFLPLPRNQRFDKAADAARGQVVQGLALTGGSVNSPGEAQLWTGPYVPRSSDYDQTNIDTFNRLDTMRSNAAKNAIMTLGGVPDASGNIHPLGSPEATAALSAIGLPANFGMPGAQGQQGGQNNAPPMASIGPSNGPMNGGGGNGMPPLAMQAYSNTGNVQPGKAASGTLIGPKQRQEYDYGAQAHFQQMLMSGASADELQAEAQRMGLDPFNPASLNATMDWHKKYPKDASPRFNPPLKSVDQTAFERVSQGIPGALLEGAANGAAFGLPAAFMPDKQALVQQAHPIAEGIGEIGGAIAGTKGIGMAGSQFARPLGAFAPETMAALRNASPLAKGIATDTVYGTGRGAVADLNDPLTGAALGGLSGLGGSVLGNTAAGGISKLIGGIKASPAAQYLASKGIPMTTGQLLGGGAKTLEDRLAGLPGFGVIGKRRGEAFQGFDQAARNEAGAPIGAQFAPEGNWMEKLPPEFGQAYDNATAGVQVPLDAQFRADMTAARTAGTALPPDLATKFDAALTNRMTPVATSGELTGDAYQQAHRGLGGYKAEHTKPGFEQDYRDALSQAQSALRGQMERGGGQSVIDGLGQADQGYRLGKVLQTAQRQAVNGSNSGIPGVITPAQLNNAAMANLKKFGGQRPFAALGDAGQEVLPSKVPDSGTAGRIAQYAAPAALLGAGEGSDAMGWTQNGGANAMKLALAYAMLRGGGSKVGQKALNKTLFDRPDVLKRVGAAIGKRKGLFGTAAVPLMLEANK